MKNTVNIVDVYHAERKGPTYGNRGYEVKFYGKTPGGKDLQVNVELPDYGVTMLASFLHEIVKEQKLLLQLEIDALKGE